MVRLIYFLFLVFIMNNVLFSQGVPKFFNYQVSVRDAVGKPLVLKQINFQISISDNINGINPVFQETNSMWTNNNGIASFQIGNGKPVKGSLSIIPFLRKEYFISIAVDTDNTSNFKPISTTQLISVPYALVSDSANYSFKASQLVQLGAKLNEVLKWNGSMWVPGIDEKSSGTGGTVTNINTGTGLSGGPITSSGTISISNTGVASGTYGSSSEVPVISINAQGQITNVIKASISGNSGGTVKSVIAGTGLDGGTITNTGTISLKNTGVIANTYGSSLKIPKFTVNAQGQITSVSEESLNSVGSQWASINSDIYNSNTGAVKIGYNSSNGGELWLHKGNESPNDRIIFLGYKLGSNPINGKLADFGIYSKADGLMKAGIRYTGAIYELYGTQKNFIMDHPREKDSLIVFSCIEGPESAAYERGTGQLINGKAEIKYSENFRLVVNCNTITINLTPISINSLGLAIIEKKEDAFLVGELHGGTGNYLFDWEIKGKRKGFENFQTTRPKSEYRLNEPNSIKN